MKNTLIEKIKNGEKFEPLKTLTGSQEQVAWATKIQAKMIKNQVFEIEEEVASYGWDDDFVVECIEDLINVISTDDASEIISWSEN